ncbi:hypothetical protein [Hyphomonas adhaerens]|uniref:hypothetical protein n=1 Tax=Hyphomonas adhaerens TaxID=81029 RepID=UPI00235314CC|nr:hypothetical protein [Hyphomonas adhaerens]
MESYETGSLGLWLVTILQGLLTLVIVMLYSRRQSNVSVASDVMDAIGDTDRRTFFSGNFGSSNGSRRKVRTMVRQYVLGMFGGTVLSLLRCIAAAIALFVLALVARWLHAAVAGHIGSISDLLNDLVKMGLATFDSMTFNAFMVFGIDQSLMSTSKSLNLISFFFMLGIALTFATGFFAFLNNILTTIVSIFFPWTLFRAADPAIVIDDNSTWEKFIHFILDFPQICPSSGILRQIAA